MAESTDRPPAPSAPATEFLSSGAAAERDLVQNYWDPSTDRLRVMWHGIPAADRPKQTTLWDVVMLAEPTYRMWRATKDEAYRQRLVGIWAFVKDNFTFDQLTSGFGHAPNLALDDCGWAAMLFMICYEATGDKYALDVVKAQIKGAYEYYKDGEVANGLWYPKMPPTHGGDASTRFKALYTVGIISAALEYCLKTGDSELLPDTLAIYQWMETHLRRDRNVTYRGGLASGGDLIVTVTDNLYWANFGEKCADPNSPVTTGPLAANRPDSVREAGSVSALYGNMGMGVIQARLYQLTGDRKYLKLALETVRALNDSPLYSNQGVYINDRDAGDDAIFAGAWVEEVLTLPGATKYDDDRIFTTARFIQAKCRTKDGYWNPEWSGGDAWRSKWLTTSVQHKRSVQMAMITGNTVCMLTAAALLESMNLK